MKTIIVRLLAIVLFALALLFPSLSLSGAAAGLLLWFQTVLPTLLPCMILADFLLRVGADSYLTRLFHRPLSYVLHVSRSGSYAAFVGALSGYPMGAKTTASLLIRGDISREEAGYLLSFCNQPSPMFLTGYLGLSLLAGQRNAGSQDSFFFVIPLLLGVYGSALFVSFLYRALRRMHRQIGRIGAQSDSRDEGQDDSQAAPARKDPPLACASYAQKTTGLSVLSQLESSMMSSFEVMVKIGGYMMLFSIAEVWVDALPIPWPALKSAAMGFIEMTTGCRQIAQSVEPPWAMALCCGSAAFGGLSGFFQTQNVLQDSGLSCGRYFLWKLTQGCLAAVIVVLWFFLLGAYPGI